MKENRWKLTFRLLGIVKPLAHVMCAAVIMGVIGFLSAIFITILGGYGLLGLLGVLDVKLKTVFILAGILALIRGALRYAEQASNHYIAFKLLALIRDKVFGALRKLTPAKLEGKDKGNLISIITNDIELLEVFYAHTISPTIIAVITCAILLVFIGNLHPLFAVILGAAYLAIGYLIPKLITFLGRKDGQDFRQGIGELNSFVLESLRGIHETIQYAGGDKRLKELNQKTRDLEEIQDRLKKQESLTRACNDAGVLFFSLLMFLVSVWLYENQAVGMDSVILATITCFSGFGPVIALSNLSNNLNQTFASAERVLAILDDTPMVEEVEGGVTAQYEEIKAENVSFSYEEEVILKDFDFTIPTNTVVGISGKSGSGKSTFLKLLMRFWDVDGGSIKIGATNIKECNTKSLRALEGYVTQETVLFRDTIGNNIRIGKMDATDEEVIEACKKASLHDFIMTLPNGYDTMATELGGNLSGGERQRIGIARAFLHDSPVLYLDEPTSNLDSLNEGIILKSIKEFSEEKTVVLVSHRASTLGICDVKHQMKSHRTS